MSNVTLFDNTTVKPINGIDGNNLIAQAAYNKNKRVAS